MGKIVFQIDTDEFLAVNDGQVTPDRGVRQKIALTGESIVLFVLEHSEPGPANIRVEVSGHGHRESQVYHGLLPESGTIDFSVDGVMASVAHGGKER